MIPDILQAFKEFYVDKCPDPITQEEAKIWTEHRAFVLDAYMAWARGYPTGNHFPRSEVDAFFQQFRDLYETMSNQELFDVKSLNITELDMGSAEASFAGLFKRMEKQFPSQYPADASDFTGCYMKQHILDGKFSLADTWPQFQKSEMDLMMIEHARWMYFQNAGEYELEDYYAIANARIEIAEHLYMYSQQSLAKAKARVNDVKRIFGLDDYPRRMNLTGGDPHLYEKGIKLIPGILQAYHEFFVERCPEPITNEEARIWAEHRAFVLDTFLEWDREHPTTDFRDIYESMPIPELFDVQSLNTSELYKGSVEASFEELFKQMESRYFRGPVNDKELKGCYWKQYMLETKFSLTETTMRFEKEEDDWTVMHMALIFYHNHSSQGVEDLNELHDVKYAISQHMLAYTTHSFLVGFLFLAPVYYLERQNTIFEIQR
ncbi:unnamed protein product, partial [Mesorhabditis spiculigera]